MLGASEALNGLPELYQMVQCSPGIVYKARWFAPCGICFALLFSPLCRLPILLPACRCYCRLPVSLCRFSDALIPISLKNRWFYIWHVDCFVMLSDSFWSVGRNEDGLRKFVVTASRLLPEFIRCEFCGSRGQNDWIIRPRGTTFLKTSIPGEQKS